MAAVAPGQMSEEGGRPPDACRWPILIVWWEGSCDWDRRNTVRERVGASLDDSLNSSAMRGAGRNGWGGHGEINKLFFF